MKTFTLQKHSLFSSSPWSLPVGWVFKIFQSLVRWSVVKFLLAIKNCVSRVIDFLFVARCVWCWATWFWTSPVRFPPRRNRLQVRWNSNLTIQVHTKRYKKIKSNLNSFKFIFIPSIYCLMTLSRQGLVYNPCQACHLVVVL